MIKDVLGGDLVIIRATFEHLIDNYLRRDYVPGLLRLLIDTLAKRGEWSLLRELLCRAIRQRTPFMNNRDVAALLNYTMHKSTKLGAGQTEVKHSITYRKQI
jgi:hypothetical protein